MWDRKSANRDINAYLKSLPGEAMPTVLQTLESTAPAKSAPVRLIHPPGERGDYSGGGVMVGQMVLEEATGHPLYANRLVMGLGLAIEAGFEATCRPELPPDAGRPR